MNEARYAEQSAWLGVAHFFERAYVGVADKRARVREILTITFSPRPRRRPSAIRWTTLRPPVMAA